MRYVVFSMGDERYALSVEVTKEITLPKKTTPLPESEPYMKGIFNLRGGIIPVFDLAEKLGLGSGLESSQQKKKIIVVEIGDKTIGFSVDDVLEVVTFEKLDSPPVSDKIGAIVGIARDDEGMVIVLDPEKLI